MADVQADIIALIASDPVLTGPQPGGLAFTVINRWPVRPAADPTKKVPGQTAEAFDPAQGQRLKRIVIVLDGGEVQHPSRSPGPTALRWDSFPTLHLVAEAQDSGKTAVKAADNRIAAILSAATTTQGSGDAREHISYRIDSLTAREDFEGFPGNVRMIRRWRATGYRKLA